MTNAGLEGTQQASSREWVQLQPIAAPSILGLFGFAGATFMVAANLAHWYGTPRSALYLAPFAAMLGGLAQFLAGMWAVKARDGLAYAMHGTWGAFWLAYGGLSLLFATGTLVEPHGAFPELGFWFVVLAAITWSGTAASLHSSFCLFSVLAVLATGSTTMAIASLAGLESLRIISGYLFMISAGFAWYTATAMMLEGALGRAVLPVGKSSSERQRPALGSGLGEPGVRHGQ